jgi:platelet-activating factor acetylhydrolase IB subunit alpha
MKSDLKAKRDALKKKDDTEDEKPEPTILQQKSSHDQVVSDYVASGSRDKTIKIWETRNGRCVLTLSGHDNWVTDLVFHPNGKFLLSTSDDKSIRIWDLSNGR